jgi:pyruvate-ferredoxin/flavodoxin oxidoreductase
METRYKMLTKSDPETAKELIKLAQQDVYDRWNTYEQLAAEKPIENKENKQS